MKMWLKKSWGYIYLAFVYAAIVAAFLVLTANSSATCNPNAYFCVGFDEVEAGEYFAVLQKHVGGQLTGFDTPVIDHFASHGHWLIPGISYDLLDLGVAADPTFTKGELLAGPSLRLGSLLDPMLIKGISYLPHGGNPDAYATLTAALSHQQVALDVGIMEGGLVERNAAGRLILVGVPNIKVDLRVAFGAAPADAAAPAK